MIAELFTAAVLVFSGSSNVSLTGFADGRMHVDFGSEIDQLSEGGDRDVLVPRLCCGASVMSSDGTIWYSNGAMLVRVRHDQFRTRDTFPIAHVYALAAGPDGSVWFSNYDRYLGHIDASGVVHQFPDPLIAYYPRFGTIQIVVSNDGAAWCKGVYPAFIARVDVNGATSMAAHYGEVIDLVGPARRGGVWVSSLDHIKRLDAPDHVAEALPVSAMTFVETNDGSIWYSGGSGVVQWKSGTITTFPLDPPSSQYFTTVAEIVPESDTTVWVHTSALIPVPNAAQAAASASSSDEDFTHIYRVSAPAFPKRHAAH
jgi:hypothetical protein